MLRRNGPKLGLQTMGRGCMICIHLGAFFRKIIAYQVLLATTQEAQNMHQRKSTNIKSNSPDSRSLSTHPLTRNRAVAGGELAGC